MNPPHLTHALDLMTIYARAAVSRTQLRCASSRSRDLLNDRASRHVSTDVIHAGHVLLELDRWIWRTKLLAPSPSIDNRQAHLRCTTLHTTSAGESAERARHVPREVSDRVTAMPFAPSLTEFAKL